MFWTLLNIHRFLVILLEPRIKVKTNSPAYTQLWRGTQSSLVPKHALSTLVFIHTL